MTQAVLLWAGAVFWVASAGGVAFVLWHQRRSRKRLCDQVEEFLREAQEEEYRRRFGEEDSGR